MAWMYQSDASTVLYPGVDPGDRREVVGQQPVGDPAAEGPEDRRTLGGPPGREGQARERDHRVAAPVVEPRVAGHDRATLPVRQRIAVALGDRIAADDERVGRHDQLARRTVTGGPRPPPG